MRNPINRSNIRRPLKGILLLAILFVASNLFISSVSQFFIVNREIDNIGSYYKSIGTIQPLDENNYYINEAQELISGDPMIDYEDNRRYTLGFIEGLYNPIYRHMENLKEDDDYKTFLGDNIFTAKLEMAHKSLSADSIHEGSVLILHVKERLAGFPNYMKSDTRYAVGFFSHSVETGEKIEFINDDIIDELFKLEPGKTFIFRTYNIRTLNEGGLIKPLYDGGPLYEELDDDGHIDWDNPKWEKLKEDINVLNQNIISYSIIGTKDMTSMPITQESMKDYYLKEGRWINEEDNENQNHVAVINEDFARTRGIKIGDNIEIKMRDTEKGNNYLASAKDRRDWKTYHTSEPISFEVVGIFSLRLAKKMASRGREIYVPDSTMPKEFGNYYNLGEKTPDIYSYFYSFTLKNIEDESTFVEKYKNPLEKLGYELYFVENNGESFLNTANPVKRSSQISFSLFSILLILMQAFVVYLYVDGHRLNYAIERILGIPAWVSGAHLILPLILYGSAVSTIGGFLGYNNALGKSEILLADLAEISQTTVCSGLDIKYFILFIIMSMIPFIVMLFLKVRQLNNSSIIDLINDNKKKNNIIDKDVNIEENMKIDTTSIIDLYSNDGQAIVNNKYMPLNGRQLTKKDSRKGLRSFSINYCLRSKISSMLLILLAGIFVFSLLWMNYLIIRNNDLINKAFDEIIIAGEIVIVDDGKEMRTLRGPISGSHIDNFSKTELLYDYTSLSSMSYTELYINRNGIESKYELSKKDKKGFLIHTPIFTIKASNKLYNSEIDKMTLTKLNIMDGYSLEDFSREYTADYNNRLNPRILNENGNEEVPVLVSNKAMEHFGLRLGDRIFLEPDPEFRSIVHAYGTIVGTFENLETGILPSGYIRADKESELFIYPLSALQLLEKDKLYYETLEFGFNPQKNREVLAQKEELKKMVANNPFNDFLTELNIWDGELINVVEPLEKNLSLLEVLYPVTFGLSIIIASILAFMMVIRRSIDVAILRILGVKSKEVQWNLFRENLVLVIIGIIISCITIISITINSYKLLFNRII